MSSKAAKRYAKALFELANEKNELQTIHSDLSMIFNAIQQSPDLQKALSNPTINTSKKSEIVNKIFASKVSPLTVNLLHTLASNDRLNILGDIYKAFDNFYKKQKGIINATVTTAVPLNDKLEQQIYQKIKDLTGSKEIDLLKIIDPSILGGFVLNVEDLRYDASIKGKLAKIKSKLVEN